MPPPPGAAAGTMPPSTAAPPVNPADRSNIIVLNNEKPSRKTKKNSKSLGRKLRKIEPSSLLFGFSISEDGKATDLEQANPYMLDTKRLKRKSVPNLSQYYKMEDDDDQDDEEEYEKYRRRSTD